MIAYYIKLYILTLVTFLAIDMVWLGVVAPGFYRQHLGVLLAEKPNWTAAIIFYLLFIAGMLIFVVVPALEAQSWAKALVLGALFGLITYATYDLTNMATIKGWPTIVTVVDMVWGTLLAATVGSVAFQLGRWIR